MTSTFCIQLCRGQDASFAGIHSSTTCQCYSGLQSYTLLSSSCLSCPGYRAQPCGSSESISVFNVCKFNIMLTYVLQWSSWSWSYILVVFTATCTIYISPLTIWVRIPPMRTCTRLDTRLSEKLFQQIIGIPIGVICTPLLFYHFVYFYETENIQKLINNSNIQKLKPLILLSGILLMFCKLII